MTPGARGLLSEAAAWAVGLGLVAAAILHQDELQGLVGNMLGLAPAEQSVAAGYGRDGARRGSEERRSGTVEISADRHGHFNATAEINGRSIQVVVDTGATMVAMPYEDAERAGIYVKDSDFTGRVATANGTGRIAPVMLDKVSVGDITVRNVRAAVAEPGRLSTTLLGMTFLGRLQRAEMRSGVLVLQE